jgi:hypothetical protein
MNLELALALAAHLLVSTGAGSAPAAATPPGGPPAAAPSEAEPEPGAPTRGPPDDLALWRSMRDDYHRLLVQRAAAHKLYYRLRPEKETKRLAAIAEAHPELLPQIEPLRRRLYDARKETYDIMAAQWPVDPRRACRSEMDDLAIAMEAQGPVGSSPALVSARVAARVCTEKLRSAVEPLAASNAKLGAAVKDVDQFLATAQAAVAEAGRSDHDDHDADDREPEDARMAPEKAPVGAREK